MDRVRLAVVINGTGVGGAERMLARVLTRLPRDEFDLRVYSLDAIGSVGQQLLDAGISVQAMNFLRHRIPNPWNVVTLARELKRFAPDVVQGWMYLGNLYGGLAAKLLSRRLPVAWNIRHSTLDPQLDSRSLRWSAWLGGKLSALIPDRVILCAEAARSAHERVGYLAEKMKVIPNGFDIGEFRPDPIARQRIREELAIPDDALLVGLVGRFHPHKDHRTFVAAARFVADRVPNAHFVLVGDDQVYSATDVWSWIDAAGLHERFRLTGARRDVAAINASLDISVCCSTTEGFPNVVGEAMACGVACVATDVGECAEVVGNSGLIVPPQDALRLSHSMIELLDLSPHDRRKLGMSARQRVMDRYDIRLIVERYRRMWQQLAGRPLDDAHGTQRRAA